jgi:hypothetical protein
MDSELAAIAKDYFAATVRRDQAKVVSLLYPGDLDKFKAGLLWCATAMERFGETAGLLECFGPGVELEDLRVLSPEAFLTRYLEGLLGQVPPAQWQDVALSFRAGVIRHERPDQAVLPYAYQTVLSEEMAEMEGEISFQKVNGRWYVMLHPGMTRFTGRIRSQVEEFDQRAYKDRKPAPANLLEPDIEPFAIWGYRDASSGETVMEPRFAAAGEFYGGLAPVKFFRKWGYITADGQTSIAPRFDQAEPFYEGLAAVAVRDESLDLRWGYIGITGEMIIPPQFASAGRFDGGVAEVTLEQDGNIVTRLLDKDGGLTDAPPEEEKEIEY